MVRRTSSRSHDTYNVSQAKIISTQWVCHKSSIMSNTQDKLGRTPLLVALMSGAEVEAIEVLVREGEMVNITDEVGRTAAEAAILYCSSSVLEVILGALKKMDKGRFNKVGFSNWPTE